MGSARRWGSTSNPSVTKGSLTFPPGFRISSEAHIHSLWCRNSYTLNVWDVGGQRTLRPYWRNYFEATDAVVWVVDSSDRMRVGDCKEELRGLLGEEVCRLPTFVLDGTGCEVEADASYCASWVFDGLEAGRRDASDLCQQAGYSRFDDPRRNPGCE